MTENTFTCTKKEMTEKIYYVLEPSRIFQNTFTLTFTYLQRT